MTNRLFGTDGIRGRAGAKLTPELALRAAYAFASQLGGRQVKRYSRTRRPTVVIGGDSRLSSTMLDSAVTSGIALAGCDSLRLGLVPTPFVPLMLQRHSIRHNAGEPPIGDLPAAGGIMITASHNPVEDNGLKFFGADGLKISEERERLIEATVAQAGFFAVADQLEFGAAYSMDPFLDYQRFLAGVLPRRSIKRRMRLVVDCAYGATCQIAPLVFTDWGFDVLPLHAEFDGHKVNVGCGATDLGALSRAVVADGAALGLAFDGDGDRVLAVDHMGCRVDGDCIVALFATQLKRYREPGAVVMTQMTNMGIEQALKERGIKLWRTEVGDSNVMAELRKRQLHLGGEQAGHIILRDLAVSGDGILAGLQLALLVRGAKKTLAELVKPFPQFPQQLTNLRVADRQTWRQDHQLLAQLKRLEASYQDVRFYLRPSGTENLLRVLTEARDAQRCQKANAEVCAVFLAWDGKR